MLRYIVECQKASKDIVYFVENFLKVSLYPYQKAILWSMVDNDRVLVNSCRQSGKTSCIIWYSLWKALFQPNSLIGIIGLSSEQNKQLLSRIKLYLGDDMEELVLNSSSSAIQLGESEILTFTPSNCETAMVGRSMTDFLWDEMAFSRHKPDIPKKMETMTGMFRCKYHILSTKNVLDDYFYKKYVESKHPKLNESKFKSIAVNWWDIPNRDTKWKEQLIKSIGQRSFDIEYLSDF